MTGSARFRALRLTGRYLLLCTMLLITVGPLAWQVLTALKGRNEDIYGTHATLLPQHPTLANFRAVLAQVPIWSYIDNTLVVVALSVTSQLVFSTLGGYMLSRTGWRGARAVLLLLIVSMMFPFESIMVSLYISIRSMGLEDNLLGVWLPGVIGAFNVLIMRSAFLAVPNELEEAALLDGAGEWRRFARIFLPAATGAMMVVIINTFVTAWDDFLWPLIVIRSQSHFTLTLGLAQLSNSDFGLDERTVMAGSVISVIPVLILFIATQRWFYKGVQAGGVKM